MNRSKHLRPSDRETTVEHATVKLISLSYQPSNAEYEDDLLHRVYSVNASRRSLDESRFAAGASRCPRYRACGHLRRTLRAHRPRVCDPVCHWHRSSGRRPRRCRVPSVLPPETIFEVVLPAEWNGRIVMRGNGGYAWNSPDAPGSIRDSERTVADGFMSVYTNTGHVRIAEPRGTFAFNNRQKGIDYSFRAVGLTIQTAMELVGIYYGQPPSYTYWRGCSTVRRDPMVFL